MDRDREYVEYVSARLPALHRAAYLLCGDPHRADDLVQATFVSLFVHWRRARRAENLDAYVHRILVRRYLDEQRRGWARVRLMWTVPEPDRRTDTAPNGDRDLVMSALRQLPKGQRTVLVLRFFSDLSVDDTAAAMGCSAGNVKSQTARGLEAMRRVLFPDDVTAERRNR